VSFVRRYLVTPAPLILLPISICDEGFGCLSYGKKIFFIMSQALQSLEVTQRLHPALEQHQSTLREERYWAGRMAWLAELRRCVYDRRKYIGFVSPVGSSGYLAEGFP
jgi:hypothetical protein